MSQIYQPVKKTVKNLMAIPQLKPHISEGKRASVFGMVESGKTTILGLLELTCINFANMSNQKDSKTNFHFLVQERTSGIRQASSDLRKGMFPEKTPIDNVFEADFYMRFGSMFSKQQICLGFCETAGEEITKLLDQFQHGQYDINPGMFQHAGLIHEYILDSDGIIIIAPVTRAAGIEEEKGSLVKDPDVNLSRLLAGIYQYKQSTQSRSIRGIGVFLTKYDALREYLESKNMNLKTPEGVHSFMSKYFPETYAVLGWYGLENVKFWPTGVEIETEKNELGQIVAKRHPLNPIRGYKIKVDHNRNVPIYTEQPFHEFIEWLRKTIMA